MLLRAGKWLASGVLGWSLLTGTGLAQSPRSAYTGPATTESIQPVEAMIESAWLADPLTFQYALKAHITNQGVELRGYVPTQMLKQRAVSVAQSVSSVAIVDQLQVQPNMEILLPGLAGPEFGEEALNRLAKVNPQQSQQVSVQIGVGGVVTLTGQATSLDEKLKYARALRGVHGCAAVRNNIVIGGGAVAVLPPPPPAARPAPIIRMEPTPIVQAKTEPIRLRVDPPKPLPADAQLKQAVAKVETPVKPQPAPVPENKPAAKPILAMTPPVKPAAERVVTNQPKVEIPAVLPNMAPVKSVTKPETAAKTETPAPAKVETVAKPQPKGNPAQIIFD